MKRHMKRLALLVIVCFGIFISGCASSGDTEGNYNFGNMEPKDIDPWVYIEDTSITENTVLLGFASSSGRLAITIGVLGITFSIFYMAIRLMFARNANAKEEIKQEIVLKCIIAIMIFSIPFWLGIMKEFSEVLI